MNKKIYTENQSQIQREVSLNHQRGMVTVSRWFTLDAQDWKHRFGELPPKGESEAIVSMTKGAWIEECGYDLDEDDDEESEYGMRGPRRTSGFSGYGG